MSEDWRTTVESFFDAFARRDFVRLRELLDPQVEWNAAESFIYAEGSPYRGPDAVLGIMRQIDAEWDHFVANPEEFFGEEGIAITRGRYRGKFNPTGFRLNAEFVHVFRLKNGRIVVAQTYTDTAQFRDAVQRARQESAVTQDLIPS
jgi:ketosteroid isomerase-like protein